MSLNQAQNLDCAFCEGRLRGVFCELEQAALIEFNAKKTTNQYKKGQVIFYQDNQPFGIFCVFSGKIKLYRQENDGRQHILRIAGSGDILGYRSLFAEESYHATAETLEDSTICFIDKNVFFSVLEQDPVLCRHIIRKLSKELRVAENMTTNMVHRSAKERMAELLLFLYQTYGSTNPDGRVIDIQLSREDLASMVGMTTETAIRQLSDFKKQGLIAEKQKTLMVLQPEELLKISNLPH